LVEGSFQANTDRLPVTCPILGVKIDYAAKRTLNAFSPTLDRIDNKKGYVPGNVRVISHRANRLKQDATPVELYDIAMADAALLCRPIDIAAFAEVGRP
jgi:hypothetical protein